MPFEIHLYYINFIILNFKLKRFIINNNTLIMEEKIFCLNLFSL